MEATARQWQRVTQREPCPVCEHGDWCTRRADGLVKCMRVESEKPVESGGWIHRAGERLAGGTFVAQQKQQARPDIDWGSEARRMIATGRALLPDLATQLGVSERALQKLGVGRGVDDWNGTPYWSFPERNPQGEVTGIVRRYDDGAKKTIKWSRSGLYYANDWQRGPATVFLPEGGSDTAALITMGLSAIGRPSNIGGVKLLSAMLSGLRRQVVVLGERDEKPHKRGVYEYCKADCKGCPHCFPGMFGARQTAERLGRALRRRVDWAFCPDEAKDVREWLIRHGPTTHRRFLEALKPSK